MNAENTLGTPGAAGERPIPSLREELGTLFWLQWRLTRAMFRSRRDRARLVQLLLVVLQLVFTFPFFVLMGAGLAVGMILMRSEAAYELAMLVNTGMFFLWLVMPSSYSSQVVERFEMSRLFQYPISFRSIVIGSTAVSLASMTGLWTLPILVGEALGLAWHAPWTLPLILIGLLPTFGILVLTGRLVDDLFDLISGDRRLRNLVIFILALPFIFLWVGQYIVQYAAQRYALFSGPLMQQLNHASDFSQVFEILRLSRFLIWLPTGWATASMGLAGQEGQWGKALLFLLLALAVLAVLLVAHIGITRRLVRGDVISMGTERVRTQKLGLRLPGPPALWALVRKDLIYLRRSPFPKCILFVSPILILGLGVSFRTMPAEVMPVTALAAFFVSVLSLTVNVSIGANYFGTMDREGLASLAHSGVDRRFVFLAANLATLLLNLVQWVLLAVVGALTGAGSGMLLALYLTVFLQISGSPLYNLASILGPYRQQIEMRSNGRGNLWGLLAWGFGSLPILALVLVPYFLWRPGLALTLPLGVVYSVALYVMTLQPLAGLMERREYAILEAINVRD